MFLSPSPLLSFLALVLGVKMCFFGTDFRVTMSFFGSGFGANVFLSLALVSEPGCFFHWLWL